MKNDEKAQENHETYVAWAFSAVQMYSDELTCLKSKMYRNNTESMVSMLRMETMNIGFG